MSTAPEPPGATVATTAEELRAEQQAGKAALASLLEPVRGRILVARILTVASSVLAIAPYIALVHLGAILLGAAADGVAADPDEVRSAVGLLIGTFTARLFLYFLALAITHFADLRLGAVIRGRIIDRMGRAPLGWFTSTNSGRIRKTLQDDIAQVHTLVAHQPVEVTSAVVMPIALLVYVFVIDWRLGLLAVATLPLYAGAQMIMMRGMGEKAADMDVRLGVVSSRMVEFVTGITVVKAFGRVGRSHNAYREAAEDFSRFYVAWVTPMLRGSSASMALVSIPVLLLVNLGGGALMVNAGWVEPQDVLATTLIALLVPHGVEVISNSVWAYQMTGAAARRITDVLETPILDDTGTVTPEGAEVHFENVSFSYGGGKNAVESVSLRLDEGSVTALIGPSGSGKSTVATLLARFADPDSGRIRLGGVDLREIPTDVLYRKVAFVLQDPQLLRMSVRDNITLGAPDATDADVRDAARAARILEVVDELPDGFDTLVGEGRGFSGGQAQRIAIARALLVDAPVLILDEATAFADPDSQAEIQAALSELVKGRTVLVIAHRPESVLGADQIIVLENGKVTTQGTHEELGDHPHYRRLWQAHQEEAR